MSEIKAYRVGVKDVATAVDGKMTDQPMITKTYGMDMNSFTPVDCFTQFLIKEDYYHNFAQARYFTEYCLEDGALKMRREGKNIIAEYTDKGLGFSYSRDKDRDIRHHQSTFNFTDLSHVVTFDIIKEHFPNIPDDDRSAILSL
jgi:hypothetical protein